MGIVLLFHGQQGASLQKSGGAAAGMTATGTSAAIFAETGTGRATFRGSGAPTSTGVPPVGKYPTISYQVAFTSQPLSESPAWLNLGDRVRNLSMTRGRSFEFDRMETGTMKGILSNRDAALSPDNSASPYAPIQSTRPVRAMAHWVQPYPLFRGIGDGYPCAYPNVGTDAVVELQANDLFYGLNNSRFTPGETLLFYLPSPDPVLQIVPAGTEEIISVNSTALPMPQVPPFEVIVDEGIIGREETLIVLAILSATSYLVQRGESPQEHYWNAHLTTRVFSIGGGR